MVLSEEEKKQRNRERMRKAYQRKKEQKKIKEEQPIPEIKEEQTDNNETDNDNGVTIEEYVKYLFDQNMKCSEKPELLIKKNNSKQVSPHQPQSNGYSFLMYLVPVLLPFMRVIPELANKYLNSQNMPNTQQSLSLSQLLPP